MNEAANADLDSALKSNAGVMFIPQNRVLLNRVVSARARWRLSHLDEKDSREPWNPPDMLEDLINQFRAKYLPMSNVIALWTDGTVDPGVREQALAWMAADGNDLSRELALQPDAVRMLAREQRANPLARKVLRQMRDSAMIRFSRERIFAELSDFTFSDFAADPVSVFVEMVEHGEDARIFASSVKSVGEFWLG